MASFKKDEIDFDKLEKELSNALELDARYWRENDAKFRAIHQKVATYEEFRDIVLASHLKPLEKKDNMPEKFLQPWNTAAQQTAGKASTDNTSKETKSQNFKVPGTGLGFVTAWRRLKTTEERFSYLIFIGGNRLSQIFTTEISGGLLGQILQTLLIFQPPQAVEVLSILEALTAAKRFKLDFQFLGASEKKACSDLFAKLKSIEGATIFLENQSEDGVESGDQAERQAGKSERVGQCTLQRLEKVMEYYEL